MNILPRANQQFSLFVPSSTANARNEKLMGVLDSINERYGRGSLRLAAEGVEKAWQMRRGNLSQGYTTDWSGIPVVIAG